MVERAGGRPSARSSPGMRAWTARPSRACQTAGTTNRPRAACANVCRIGNGCRETTTAGTRLASQLRTARGMQIHAIDALPHLEKLMKKYLSLILVPVALLTLAAKGDGCDNTALPSTDGGPGT